MDHALGTADAAFAYLFPLLCGVLQGCPLSVVLLNLLVAVWVQAISLEVPDARAEAYADDAQATAKSAPVLQEALNLTKVFADLTGQDLHPKKSHSWTTSSDAKTQRATRNLHVASRGHQFRD